MLSNETVKSLLVNGFLCTRKQNDDGNTLLHLALFERNGDLVDTLLEFISANQDTDALNLQNDDGDTPLHVAARLYPKNKVIMDLVNAGAELGIHNNKNEIVDYPSKHEKKSTKNITNVFVINSNRKNQGEDDDEIIKRIDREFSKEEEEDDDELNRLTIETMSEFKPKNDLLMPF